MNTFCLFCLVLVLTSLGSFMTDTEFSEVFQGT